MTYEEALEICNGIPAKEWPAVYSNAQANHKMKRETPFESAIPSSI